MAWQVFAAAAIGKSHIDSGIPCQDAFAHALVGDTLLAVVCDGAGSQHLSHIGAELLSRQVVDGLAEREMRGDNLGSASPEELRAVVSEAVGAARAELSKLAAETGTELANYSATLVGVVANAQGGFFFHIGDGLAAAEPQSAEHACIISLPENGEYANETYFVSGEAWQEHLRVTAIAQASRAIALMSDGAAPFVMAKGNADLYRPFMDPVERYLATASASEGSKALAGTLADPRTYRITGDDKTLLVALWQ